MSEASGPSLWEVMATDPSIPIDRATLHLVIRDQRRPSRALLYPWVRVLSRVTVTIIVAGKRICPIRFSAHATMDRLCLWFLRRLVSPTAVTLLIRHFIVETNLLNFCVRNARVPVSAVVGLRPVTLSDLGNRAVIEHDLNVYRVLFVLGAAGAPVRPRCGDLDFGMLEVPEIDPESQTRRLLNLDIQTALCLMNIPFAFCLTPAEYRRAVHSLRLDASLLSVLAALTGDDTFLGWRTALPPVRVDSNADVPAMVYEHALVCEYALARLCQIRDALLAHAGFLSERTRGFCSFVIVMGAQRSSSEPLWRAIAVFRFASVGYAALRLGVIDQADYSRPDWAWAVIAVMAAWTAGTTIAYARPERRTRLLLGADLAVTVGLLLSSVVLQYPNAATHGALPVTATWMAGPVLAWAVQYGRRAGTIAALIVACCDFAVQPGAAFSAALNGAVLLLLTGVIVGHLARLAAEVEAERQRVIEVEAASRERERLARDIHDSVLQVLAMVQRRGAEAGGAAAELGRLAGQQEVALRALVGGGLGSGADGGPAPSATGEVDLRAMVLPAQTDRVTVSVPAQDVLMKKAAADELVSAMRAALDNVRRHCGERTRVWVLVEDEPDLIRVTIRDDGPGIRDGRLAEAAAAGRLGVSHSISGRLRDLGGSAAICSVPGEGTEVELRLPRVAGIPVASSPGTP